MDAADCGAGMSSAVAEVPRSGNTPWRVGPHRQLAVSRTARPRRTGRSRHAPCRAGDRSPRGRLRALGERRLLVADDLVLHRKRQQVIVDFRRIGQRRGRRVQLAECLSASRALIACSSRSAMTPRKLPSRTTRDARRASPSRPPRRSSRAWRRSAAAARPGRAACRAAEGPAHRRRRRSPWPGCRRRGVDFADDLVLRRRLGRRPSRSPRGGDRAAPASRRSRRCGRPARVTTPSRDGEHCGRDAEALGGEVDQDRARFGAGRAAARCRWLSIDWLPAVCPRSACGRYRRRSSQCARAAGRAPRPRSAPAP